MSSRGNSIAEPVIAAREVAFTFGKGDLAKQVLRGVTLTVWPGEIVALVGPSGSGKTTLLTLIGALRTLEEGSLRVLGVELLRASRTQQLQVRRRIGYIFQSHNLMTFLTAQQNVRLALDLHPEIPEPKRDRLARDLLDLVGLSDRRDYFPSQLSGGQKQRVAIARALAAGPELILADEPTSALDGQSGREAVDLMRKLARERGCPVLLVTHDTRVVDLAERVIHMEDGQVRAEGS
ncbi:MAG: ATP-binding cassette domain-containing protein [Gemmataceae bacterium]